MSQQADGDEPIFEGSVVPAFPLALLESVRSHDHPGEVLEDEDLAVSLPRRLGLTGIVETQMKRYETAARRGEMVRLDEVMGLIRLVMRRDDVEPILRETGKRVARFFFRRTPVVWQRVLHRAPVRLGLRSSRRAASRALSALHAGNGIQISAPFRIRIADSATAKLDDSGAGCELVSGLFEEQLRLYTGTSKTVTHTDCLTRGGSYCEWEMHPE